MIIESIERTSIKGVPAIYVKVIDQKHPSLVMGNLGYESLIEIFKRNNNINV